MARRYKYVNTRQYIRLPASHLIRYRLLEKDASEVATAKDMSAGGVLFTTNEELPVSSILELEINYPIAAHPIKATVKVVRVEPIKKTGIYEIGAQFLEIKDEDRIALGIPDKDTRLFVRLSSEHFSIKYRILEEKEIGVLTISTTRDISAGGVSFICKGNVSVSNMIELEISFPATPHPIKAVAKALRVEPIKESGVYKIAAQYIKIRDEDRKAIDDYIKEITADKPKRKWWWRKFER